jgi:hypothetical protein
MELNRVLELARKLIAKAESTDSPAEADALIKQADALRIKYAIDEAALDASRPAAARSKPATIEIELGGAGITEYIAGMARDIALHCGCKIRNYTSHYDGAWHSKVWGFESDLRYFEILYTTLRLHMIGALRPKPDPTISIEDNAYVLHNAGLNWFDIAKAFGWYQVTPLPGEPVNMYVNRNTGERAGWAKSVGTFKAAYKRAIIARGESALHIPPSGGDTFRRSAAQGYISRIDQRLRAIRGQRTNSSALALRVSEVEEMYESDNPDLFKPVEETAIVRRGRPRAYKELPFSSTAYSRGVDHANTASLDPATSSTTKKALG